MLWLTPRERTTLMVLGAVAMIGLGVTWWQQQRTPIGIAKGSEPPYAKWDALIQQARQINLNQATAEELERLPEIGPATAQRIVEYRQQQGFFHSPEDVLNVPGIGPKTLDAIREYITVE
jgi:competence protein ComEA